MGKGVHGSVALLTAGVLIAGCADAASSRSPGSPANHSGGRSSLAPTAGQSSPQAATARIVERLLAAAPAIRGATPLAHSPSVALDSAGMGVPGSPNLVRMTRWFKVPATPASVLAYYRAHPPIGLALRGWTSGGGTLDRQGLEFDAVEPRWQEPSLYQEPELLVTVTHLANATGVRLDAQAIWLPQRLPGGPLPLTATSVDIVVNRLGNAPTVRRTLPAKDARTLAQFVDNLPVAPPGPEGCLMSPGDDRLTFHDHAGTFIVQTEAGGCSLVTVRVNGQQRGPTLRGALDRAVTALLGLPSTYGYS